MYHTACTLNTKQLLFHLCDENEKCHQANKFNATLKGIYYNFCQTGLGNLKKSNKLSCQFLSAFKLRYDMVLYYQLYILYYLLKYKEIFCTY